RAEQAGRPVEDPEAVRRAEDANRSLAPVRAGLGLDRVEWLTVAAAPSSYRLLEFHHALGLNVAETWGQSEFMMSLMNPVDRVKLGTVGIPLPEVEARIAEDGELLLRGPHACLGYLDDPLRTAALRDSDGWSHTGDLGEIDEEGYVQIVGRKLDQM